MLISSLPTAWEHVDAGSCVEAMGFFELQIYVGMENSDSWSD